MQTAATAPRERCATELATARCAKPGAVSGPARGRKPGAAELAARCARCSLR